MHSPSTAPRPVSPDLFRRAMASVATPVSVVTTTENGVPRGTTVSAFASLSMKPPMVLVALDENSRLLSAMRRTRRFAVNILGAGQGSLAEAFARKGADKFAGVDWYEEAGLPYLAGAAGRLACAVEEFLPGGDHVIAAATVTAADVGEDAAPLTYHRHRFGTHTAA
ncbi:flavin reductase family protein [Streptomyces sp. 8L]|uniref:flavin reductase family protein n=1 Tax=Streptomyces sp. 8L TaxID=2877242 RepID=UPI001CD38E1D|nr:flavin reductase family protein [Streptomyces sp. 8L]MCA1218271.1 flavin reductase family protein [Streptomyces sp. 8L]